MSEKEATRQEMPQDSASPVDRFVKFSFFFRCWAVVERFLAPGYSTCGCCNRPWRFVEHHITDYREGSGCFPLCETCWDALGTPENRMPYYKALWSSWSGDVPWSEIEAAVLSET